MAAKDRYRHRITGLIGEYERELADIFKDVLEHIDPDESSPAPAPESVADTQPVAPEAEDDTTAEEAK